MKDFLEEGAGPDGLPNHPWRFHREDRVARFTLATPDGRQTLSPGILRRLAGGITRAAASGAALAVVDSVVPGIFAAGANLRVIRALEPAEGYAFARTGQEALTEISEAPCATIAEIDGACFGGALDLAMACDVRIATPSASFCHPGPRVGIVTGWGGTVFARRILGSGRARRLFRAGEVFDARSALDFGLIDEVVEPERWGARRREIEDCLVEVSCFL